MRGSFTVGRAGRRALLKSFGLVLAAAALPGSADAAELRVGRVAIFGNSILHGVGAPSPALGCAALLADELSARLVGPALWVGASLDLEARLDALLAAPAADLVLIHTATHELSAPVDATAARTRRIVDRIRRAWHARVVVLGPWAVPKDHPFERALPTAVAGRAAYACLEPVSSEPEAHSGGDGYHPNAAGHQTLFRLLLGVARTAPPAPVRTPTFGSLALFRPDDLPAPAALPRSGGFAVPPLVLLGAAMIGAGALVRRNEP